jgi:anti-sigma regulatory factor (Ser/Thr protein kinase)
MKVHLPNSAYLGNIDAFLASLDLSHPESLEITAHKKWISVHPVILAMVAALGQTVPKRNIRCAAFEAKSKHYFERMGLFRFLGIESGIEVTEHESAGRFVPLTQIRDSAESSRFISEMVPLLHLDPVHAEPIRYIVSELVRNVLEHAETPHGAFVAAQYYPTHTKRKKPSIRIGIADAGVGIRKTVSRSHKTESDLDAIRLALTPGITGTTPREGGTEQNAGAGLFFIKSIAAVNGDFFALYSGDAFFKLLKQNETKRHILHADPFDDRHSTKQGLPAWPGTAVGIDMVLDENEKFTTLLEHIRHTYAKAVRERKKERYKKPRFI